MTDDLQRRNRRLAALVFGVVVLMIGLSFAAVPLYSLFCQVTGFGGTTGRATSLPERIVDRTVTVRFNADVSRNLPWAFRPDQRAVDIRPGQGGLISYTAESQTDKPSAGTAIYNVSPAKAGKYFRKIACFCFGEQILEPRQTATMPVSFFIDPAFADDPNMEDVQTITLSYTFFRAESPELENAMERFYQDGENGASPSPQNSVK